MTEIASGSPVGSGGLPLPAIASAFRGSESSSSTSGGIVVVEAFHHDATKGASIGAGVVYDTNELLGLFHEFRILRYEDTVATADFGLRETRVVRLCAQKPLQ